MLGQLFTCGLLGFAASFGIILLALRMVRPVHPLARVDFHHSARGDAPIPRWGGIGLASAFIIVAIATLSVFGCPLTLEHLAIIGTSLAMFGLGFWDDVQAMGARRKLLGQLAIASAVYFLGIGIFHFKIPLTDRVIELGFWSWPATVFWLVAMTNLINLIDGVDGLAGGICLMLMLLMAVVGGAVGCVSFISAGMVGALLAFLLFNFPPARIYMGDGGAYFMGFLIGVLTITSSHKGTVVAALIAPLFVLALPILDTGIAILRRGFQGLPLFRADRKHIHHRLLETGLSRRSVVLGVYAFTAIFLGLGFIAFWWRGQYLALVVGSGILVVLLAAGKLNFSREWFAVGRILGNSLNARAEIQYAIAQTRWLIMEGSRGQSLAEICEDAAFIARKLGCATVKIRLEDGEKKWTIIAANQNKCCCIRHGLPGHPGCFIELASHYPQGGDGIAAPDVRSEATFRIVSDVLAEAWTKSLSAWKAQHQIPLRFNPETSPSSPNATIGRISATQPTSI